MLRVSHHVKCRLADGTLLLAAAERAPGRVLLPYHLQSPPLRPPRLGTAAILEFLAELLLIQDDRQGNSFTQVGANRQHCIRY